MSNLPQNNTTQANNIAQTDTSMSTQVKKTIDSLCTGLYERQEAVSLGVLATFSGTNIFYLGLPGTSKSLISRKIADSFHASYFETLMSKFTAPEDLFGPISLKSLEQDEYKRQVEGYLPCAEIAFLDEIWKSSGAILNPLLTLANERIFHNGKEKIETPLRCIFAASNELPGVGLEALYDRFLIRYQIKPITAPEDFKSLVSKANSSGKIEKFPKDLFEKIKKNVDYIKCSDEFLNLIIYLRNSLNEKEIYVSDRRWKQIVHIIKTSVYLSDRKKVEVSDGALLIYMLWGDPKDKDTIKELVQEGISAFSPFPKPLWDEIEAFYQEVLEKCLHNEDVYTDFIVDKDGRVKIETRNGRIQYASVEELKKLESNKISEINLGNYYTLKKNNTKGVFDYCYDNKLESKVELKVVEIAEGDIKTITHGDFEALKANHEDLNKKYTEAKNKWGQHIDKWNNRNLFICEESLKMLNDCLAQIASEIDNKKNTLDAILEIINKTNAKMVK